MSCATNTRSQRRVVFTLLGLAVAVLVAGCGGSALGDGAEHILSTAEAKHAILELPYRYSFKKVELPAGDSGAVAGRVVGKHHTRIDFGIGLGKEPNGVPVPRAGTGESYGYGSFIETDDLQVPGKSGKWVTGPQIDTKAQWHEANQMIVEIEEKLCRAATEEPCHEG
jgi:hypothetical protein